MKPEARVFEITSPTKKISLNYHFNKEFYSMASSASGQDEPNRAL